MDEKLSDALRAEKLGIKKSHESWNVGFMETKKVLGMRFSPSDHWPHVDVDQGELDMQTFRSGQIAAIIKYLRDKQKEE